MKINLLSESGFTGLKDFHRLLLLRVIEQPFDLHNHSLSNNHINHSLD